MPRTLKVFRTPTGFDDAYVAAPSRKAALAAWGAEVDLFARGAAELVEDAALTREPLAHPGMVIRRARGSTAQHLAALAATPKPPARKHASPAAAPPARKTRPKPKPRPSRTRLDRAERAIAEAEARHAHAEQALRARQRALDDERRALDKAQTRDRATLDAAKNRAEAAYDAAMKAWRAP